jgi:hypothetical protein
VSSEPQELRDIAMQRLEEAENVGKTAMEESEQVRRLHSFVFTHGHGHK